MMYRNLEEDRKNKIEASGKGTEETCVCPCTKSVEKGQAETPGGTQATDQLKTHWDRNG